MVVEENSIEENTIDRRPINQQVINEQVTGTNSSITIDYAVTELASKSQAQIQTAFSNTTHLDAESKALSSVSVSCCLWLLFDISLCFSLGIISLRIPVTHTLILSML